MTAPLLHLEGISKSFGSVRALKSVSFDLHSGEVHALLGENGAGKSTLIKVMTGAHRPDGGSLEMFGQKVPKLNPASARAHGLAAIYQQPALFPELSVEENIALVLEEPSPFRRVGWVQRKNQAAQLLKRVGARIDPATEVSQLSMPEQQLVEIARALGAGARILIMDEPTASLTAREVELLLALVRDLRSEGVGIIYITHRLEEVFQVADRVTVLRDGESIGTRNVRANSDGLAPADQILTEGELIQMMVGREVSTIFPPATSQHGAVMLRVKGLGCECSGVHDVDLEIREGEILGLAGLVGAGRTELARVLFGITPLDSGTILLQDKPLHVTSPREAVEAGIAYVPEDRLRHGIILEMPIAANITMSIHPKIFPGSWLQFGAERALADQYIRELGIKTPSARIPASNLSGGNQQKVALARWLATKPRVLILDEPTQGVDVGAKSEIHKLIRHLAAQGLAVLMISSDLSEIVGMSDRIAVMHEGTVTTILPGNSEPHAVMLAALGQTEAAKS